MKSIIDQMIQSEQTQKKLIGNTEYIEWLLQFTTIYPKFTDNTWLYSKEKISVSDNENVKKLTNFFTAIDRYHTKNLLSANSEGYDAWYNIKYKDTYFAIGVCVGQGAYNFVVRYQNYEAMLPEKFIDFESIMQDKVAPGFEQKQAKLQELEELVDEMLDIGTPFSAIQTVLNKNKDR